MAGLRRSRPFWSTVVAAFIVVALYPIALFFAHPSRFSTWLRNDLSFSVFGLWVLPLLFGLVITSITPNVLGVLTTRDRRVFGGLAALLVTCAIVVTIGDLGRFMDLGPNESIPALVEPVMFAAPEPFGADADARKTLRQTLMSATPIGTASATWAETRLGIIRMYGAAYPGFTGFADFWTRGNIVAKAKFAINILAAVTAALLFASLLAAVWIAQKHPQAKLNRDGFIVACSLAMLWFPLRLYTEWYIRYYSLNDLFAYAAFWLLAVVAAIALIAVVAVLKPRKVSVVIPTVGAVFSGIATAVGCLNPDALWAVTKIVDAFTLPLFAVLAVVLASFLAVFAASVAQFPGGP